MAVAVLACRAFDGGDWLLAGGIWVMIGIMVFAVKQAVAWWYRRRER